MKKGKERKDHQASLKYNKFMNEYENIRRGNITPSSTVIRTNNDEVTCKVYLEIYVVKTVNPF